MLLIGKRLSEIRYNLYVHERRRVKGAKRTLVFLHGIGNSGAAWDKVIDKLDDEPVNIVVVDLLGFGKSPKPLRLTYDAGTQARALRRVLLRDTFFGKVTIVGHSMGALVAVEFAKRYGRLVDSMVLCSPPLYDDRTSKYLPDRNAALTKIYSHAISRPDQFIAMSNIAKKHGLTSRTLDVSHDTMAQYSSALRMTVINQTSLKDIAKLRMPIDIIYGKLDPFIIGKQLRKLAKSRDNIRVITFIGGHEIERNYVQVAVNAIRNVLH